MVTCWSCNKAVSFKQIRDADGNCPKCGREICLETIIEQQQFKLAKLENEVEKLKKHSMFNATIIHNMVVANQSAWLEWKKGRGAERAMRWIHNGLVGPGHIPGVSVDATPQEWCDRHSVVHHDHESH